MHQRIGANDIQHGVSAAADGNEMGFLAKLQFFVCCPDRFFRSRSAYDKSGRNREPVA